MVSRDKDANTAWTAASDGTLEERRYHCPNWRADVSAFLTSAGKMVETGKSSAYGIAIGVPAGDSDTDLAYTATDDGNITSGSYDVRKDAELDGDHDANDVTYAKSITGTYQTLGRGVLSSTAVANRKGYAGYESDINLVKLSHVRHRVMDSTLGRWTRRDRLGYLGGNNLYAYPAQSLDPSGDLWLPGIGTPGCTGACTQNWRTDCSMIHGTITYVGCAWWQKPICWTTLKAIRALHLACATTPNYSDTCPALPPLPLPLAPAPPRRNPFECWCNATTAATLKVTFTTIPYFAVGGGTCSCFANDTLVETWSSSTGVCNVSPFAPPLPGVWPPGDVVDW